MSYADYTLFRKLKGVKPSDLGEPLRTIVLLTMTITLNTKHWEDKYKPDEDTWIRGYCDALNTISKALLESRLDGNYLHIGIDEEKPIL